MLGFEVSDTGTLKTLSDIGVSIQKDGSLKFDKTKLDKEIISNNTERSPEHTYKGNNNYICMNRQVQHKQE